MGDGVGVGCVVYAAKSTEDRLGSIREQLRECREAIDGDPRREFVAQYSDEAVSGYRRDRGPGLADALAHAEDLAVERGVAELWAQHSDRLARGDGRTARHTVELALWALKRDVRIRTLQDPDTFRDLLYAVVTGERNNEDSRRKGLATQAGRRRAIARGDFIGHLPDGYRLAVDLDAQGRVRKRMEIDPVRRELYELMFRLALRGRTCGQIARTVNDRGWLTKSVKRGGLPGPFEVGQVWAILRNPRYAGLSTYGGEVLARGCWPGYISERQHHAIRARLAGRCKHVRGAGESYLLTGLARCGVCGGSLQARTGRPHHDGTYQRAYLCTSHARHRGRVTQCKVPPIDAGMLEAMFTASIGTLLAGPPNHATAADTTRGPRAGDEDDAVAQVREAVLAGGQEPLGRALEELFARMQPDAALIRDTAVSQRLRRELQQAERLRAWADQEANGRTDTTRTEARELAVLVRGWFATVTVRVDPDTVVISATRRRHTGPPTTPVEVRVDRAAWVRFTAPGSRLARRPWNRAELIGALQAWADAHGRSPTAVDWAHAANDHPEAQTLLKRFATWNGALRKAGLPSVAPRRRYAWDDLDMINALTAWTRTHGRPPASMEWMHADPTHPNANTVREHFGSWPAALHAAGLPSQPRTPRSAKQWSDPEILKALAAWTAANGRRPVGVDFSVAPPGCPSATTVRRHFGNWRQALQAAGLAPRASPPK
jgi:Recombinase/Resolvase, N terminal domain/Homing endonuclease associated repeat/Recombinase zinc beta ribbon domain